MMSLTPEVSEFLDKLGSFYELVNDEKQQEASSPRGEQVLNGNASDAMKTALSIITRSSQSRPSSLPSMQAPVPDLFTEETDEDEEEQETDRLIFREVQTETQITLRRGSADSFKSAAESQHDDSEKLRNGGDKVMEISAEMEEMKRKMLLLENMNKEQADRLKRAEGKIDFLTRERERSCAEKTPVQDATMFPIQVWNSPSSAQASIHVMLSLLVISVIVVNIYHAFAEYLIW